MTDGIDLNRSHLYAVEHDKECPCGRPGATVDEGCMVNVYHLTGTSETMTKEKITDDE